MALTLASAIWSVSISPKMVPRHAAAALRSTAPTAVTVGSPSSTTTPRCIAPDGCTTIDPNTYRPSYDSIRALVTDAAAVFIGTVLPFRHDAAGGKYAAFSVDRLLYGEIPRTYPEPPISQGDSGDVPVVVGNQYLVFWTIDPSGPLYTCVVGGTRGIFDYDAATQTVTRIATRASRIPAKLSLAQVIALLPAPNVPTPARVQSPPLCSPSVTGG